MKKKTVVLSILFWSVLSHANLIPNSGFEEGLPRIAWKALVKISVKNAHSGRQSLQMTGTDEKKMIHAKWSRSVPVKPNTVYTFSVWIRTENADARVGLFLHDENDQYIGHNNIWPPSVSGTCDWTKTTIVFNRQQDFELSAKGLRDGMMFRAELFAENELKTRASESIRILPQPPGKTTRENRFLRVLERDGKPFLPVLFHPVPIRATPEWIYSRLKQDHYNSIGLILPPEMGRDTKFSDIGLILKQAAKYKFPAVVRLNTRCTASGKQNEFRNFADFLNVRKKILELCTPHENVLAFYLMDEPGPEHWEGNLKFKESDLGKMTKAAREIAPYHPLTINYNSYVTGKPIYGGFSSFDFLYYDSYPFLDSGTPRRNPCEFFAADAKRLNDSAASFGMPVFFWIATYGYGDASRMPTPDEYQNQVYTALIHRTRGIEYFTDYPVSVPLIQRVRAVHKKIAAFSPVLLDPETECESRNQEFLHYAILKRHGKTYVLAANTSSEKTGTLHIDGAAPLVLKPVQSDFYELKNGVLQSF